MTPPELAVIYEDADLLVLDKPAGLLSVPGRGEDKQDCLSKRVQLRWPDALIVHRLDMATSGLMVLARGLVNQRILNEAFSNRAVTKRYTAVVDGVAQQAINAWHTIDLPIIVDWPNRPRRIIDAREGKPSLTHWRVLSKDEAQQTTRVELEPVTGRSHQLRVHLQAIGHPILGDALYGCTRVQGLADRLLLHACAIEFKHPVKGDALQLKSTVPF